MIILRTEKHESQRFEPQGRRFTNFHYYYYKVSVSRHVKWIGVTMAWDNLVLKKQIVTDRDRTQTISSLSKLCKTDPLPVSWRFTDFRQQRRAVHSNTQRERGNWTWINVCVLRGVWCVNNEGKRQRFPVSKEGNVGRSNYDSTADVVI